MAGTLGNTGKKDLNFELNLLPVFDILSVCICFLLMTVVWIQVSALKTSQAVGGQSQSDTKSPPAVWVTLTTKNDIEIAYKNTPTKMVDRTIHSSKGTVSWSEFESTISNLSHGGKFEIALVMPSKSSSYADVIRIMDSFKKIDIKDIGLAPL